MFYKAGQMVLQNNAGITEWDNFCFKLEKVLKNGAIIGKYQFLIHLGATAQKVKFSILRISSVNVTKFAGFGHIY